MNNHKSLLATMLAALFVPMLGMATTTYYGALKTQVAGVSSGMGKVYAATTQTEPADSDYSATSHQSANKTGSSSTFYAYAKANPGYDFLGWAAADGSVIPADYESSANPYGKSVTATSKTSSNPTVGTAYAYFGLHEYDAFQVTFKPVELEGAGSYTVDGAAISADTILPATATTHVQNFSLVATPASSDYIFVRWYATEDGEARTTISTDASLEYSATASTTIGAEFRVKNDVVIHFQPTVEAGVSYKVDNADTVSGSVVDKTYERAETKTVALTIAGSYAKQPRWWYRETGSEEKVYWTYAKSPSRTFAGEVDVGVDFFNPEDCNLVAQVGDEPFESLVDAVKAWGPGRTLKLLADVTSTETVVVTVNANISSQNWFLELGDHVWTANGCDAIQVYVCGGAEINQNYGLKVYANQQGGITAADRNCIKCVYDNEATRYRPRIEIYGGEYNGSYVIFYSTATSSSGPNEGCSVWIYAGRDDGSAPVFNGNFALYKCPVNIYSGFFNGNSFHHYIVTSTANVSVYGGSFKNRDAMPKMNGGGGSPKIVFPDNIAIYVNAEGRYNVIPESSVAGLAYEAVSAAYNDTRFSAYMHEVDGQNRYKNFYWADADLAIPNIDKVFYRTITLGENVTATADATVSTGNATPPCTLDVTAEGASYSGTVKISNSSARFVIKGQTANVIGNVKNYAVSCSADEANKVYTYSLVSAAASITVGSATTYYATLADAIAAATEAGVTEITILNGATESPDGAWKVENGKLVYNPGVARIGDVYYATFAEAIAVADAAVAAGEEEPVIVVLDATAEIGNADWRISDGYLVRKVYAAQIVGGAKFESLPEAVEVVQDGQTIMLLSDVALDEPLNVELGENTVTLDLGGKTLTGRTNLRSGSLTVANGTVAGGNLQALNVYGSDDPAAENYSVLAIAGTVQVTADVYGVCLFGKTAGGNGYGAVVNLAGTVSTTGDGSNGAVFVSGNLGKNVEGDAKNVINVTGTITSATDAAIALNGLATVNVGAGAKVTGNTAIAVKRGTLNVEGGAIQATGAKDYDVVANLNGTEMTGAAISVTDSYSQYGALSVAVSGGTVKSSNADALYMKDATYQSDASLVVSGGYFSSKVPVEFCATGLVPTTKPGANGLYTVTTPATVTFEKGETELTVTLPEGFTYPSGDPAEIALANPTYTSDEYTFGGWRMTVGDTTKVVSALPAGAEGDVTLVATWTKATKIEIDIAVPTQEEPQATETVEVKVTDEWVKDNVTVAQDATPEQKAAAIVASLNETKSNGLTGLENYVLGQDPTAKVKVNSEQGTTTAMPVKNTIAEKVQTADTGFKVQYSLDEVTSTGVAKEGGEGTKQETSDLSLDLEEATSGETTVSYYKMTATITKTVTTGNTETEVEVSTVKSENTIGVVAVKDAPATTIIGVPWKSLEDGGNIKLDNLVRTANLTPGDTMTAYDSTTKTYSMWELQETENGEKEWVPNTTVTPGSSTTSDEASEVSMARGSGVWLTRQKPEEPIYLVGQVADSAEPTPLEKPEAGKQTWNIVASPSVEPVDVAELLEGKEDTDQVMVPTAGAPKNFICIGGVWGYVSKEPVEGDPNGFRPVFVTTDTTIPACTGFFYLNGDSTAENKKINWNTNSNN